MLRVPLTRGIMQVFVPIPVTSPSFRVTIGFASCSDSSRGIKKTRRYYEGLKY